MRKIACQDLHGVSVEAVLDEFNERCGDDLKIAKETDIISISVRKADPPHIHYHPGGDKLSTVIVTIFYWDNDAP